MRPFEYVRADDPAAAVALVSADPEAEFLAGGTTELDLVLKDGVLEPARLVDITRLPLRAITRAEDTLRVGALVTMNELAADATVSRMHAILGASEHCIALHASDLCVPLVALDTVVDIQGVDGSRSVPLTQFYLLPRERPDIENVLAHGELITGIRIPLARIVSAVDAGRVLNHKLARSQIIGGAVMGTGMTMLEEIVFEPETGRIANATFAGYLIPANADVADLDVVFVGSPDTVRPIGIKGMGEISVVGVSAAIANAAYHATGRRIRSLPITVEQLL